MRSLSKILFVVCISAMLSLSCFSGTVGGGSRVGGVDAVPKSNSIIVDFETPSRIIVTMSAVYEGDDASAMRTLFDIDADGNIIASEVTAYMDTVNGPLDPVDGPVEITLDGNGPMNVEMIFEVEGAEGTVNSAEPFKITFLETIQFPEPDSSPTHTYAFDGGTEFVGGDEPWENEFIGGDEPWENEFIGDDPWNVNVDMDFMVYSPPDWEFDTTDWPTGLEEFINPEGTLIEMNGAEVRNRFNSTFGGLDGLVIKETEKKVDILPESISIVVDLERVNMITLNMTAVYLGESARGMREKMDSQSDGTIQSIEVEQYLSNINGPLEVVDSVVVLTLDGQRPSDVSMNFDVVGAVGLLINPEELKVSFLETILFTDVEPKGTHTYGFEGAEEFVGGDEPWDDEFVGGDEPWDNEFIGDDPWDNRVDFQFNFFAPEGWELDQTGWPTGLSDYVGLDGGSIEMDGPEARGNYNTTFGSLDSLVIGTGVDIVQTTIDIVVDIEREDLLRIIMKGIYDGSSATAMRMLFDTDFDGVVSATEVSSYLDIVNGPLEVIDSVVPITLDGNAPTMVEMTFDVVGAEGDIDSTVQFSIIFEETLTFTLPEDVSQKTLVYDLAGAEEWVGGDEPWDNEFVGGDEPWDDEFVGGDEPWDNRVNVVFSISCPDGWTFKTGKWPAGMTDFLNKDGTAIDMDDAAVKTSYNSTVGALDSIQIQKDDGGGNGSPGFGFLVAFLAIAVATMAVFRGRRR